MNLLNLREPAFVHRPCNSNTRASQSRALQNVLGPRGVVWVVVLVGEV